MNYQGFLVTIELTHSMGDDRVGLTWATKVRSNKKTALADAETLKGRFKRKYPSILKGYFIDTGFVRVLPGMRYPLPLWRDGIRKQLAEADRIAASRGR